MTTRRHLPRLREFSGGLNLRDAQTELAENELAAAYNVTIDERGGVNSRLGRNRLYVSPLTGTTIKTLFYSKIGVGVIAQCGTKLYANGVLFKTFTTEARCGLADFIGKLCITHPVDGFFTYDGVTVTAPAGPFGNTLAVWQNKLWANDMTGTIPSRLWFSAAGDPTSWTVANRIDLREKDDDQIVCLAVAGGGAGSAGLIAFKTRSTFRIYDSGTGAYQMIDPLVGASSGLAVTSLLGRLLVLSGSGIYTTDGYSALSKISGKIDPLFTDDYAATAAGATSKRAYFSLIAGLTGNPTSFMVEYDPVADSFTINSNYSSCYALSLAPPSPTLISGSSADGLVFNELATGADDGVAINAYLQTSFIEPNAGLRARMNRARVNGRGAFTLSPLYDYNLTQTITRAINVPTGSAAIHGGYQDVYNLGQAKTIAFRAEATASSTTTIPLAVPGATTRTVGAWGLYGIDLSPVPLGRT